MQKQNERGITLIALIITIIVMLILVVVSVTVALKGNLFGTAKTATEDTELRRDEELAISGGQVTIGGKTYNSIEEYVGTQSNGVGEKVTIEPKKENYEIGEKVTLGGENFLVIADDTEKVTLLAKYKLNESGTAQTNSGMDYTHCVFSSTNYWSNETEYPVDLNTYPIPEGVTSVITIAKEYGAAKGGVGRLLTSGEAYTLENNYFRVLAGADALEGYGPDENGTWIASASNEDEIMAYKSIPLRVGEFSYNTDHHAVGIRPVVEISKSNI